jgi:hypothetical protein
MRPVALGIVIDRLLALGADELTVRAELDGIVAEYWRQKNARTAKSAEAA